MNIEIANRLVQLRKANHLSQEELASRLGISRQAVSKWERAEASPDTDNLIMLARLYGVSLDEMLCTEEIPVPQESRGDFWAQAAGEESADDTDIANNGAADNTHLLEDGSSRELLAQQQPEPVSPPVLQQEGLLYGRKRGNRWNQFPYPVLVTLVYLLLGFIGGWWHPAWLLFLTIPVYYIIGDAFHSNSKLLEGLYPICMVILFLLLGFIGGWWHPGWLVFLTVPLYYSIVDIVLHKRSWKNFVYPVLTVIIFLLLGFIGGWWHPGWLIFLTIPLYYALFSSEDKQDKG